MADKHLPQDLIMQATVIQKLASTVNHNVTELTHAHASAPIPTVAWLVRNLLELFVWTEYCTKSPENAKQFYIDAVRDFDDIVKVIKPEDVEAHPGAKEPLAHVSAARTELARLLDPGELDKQYKKVRIAAKDIGRLQFFETTFKVLSKFAHPTSLIVMMGRIPSDKEQSIKDIITKSGLDMAKESADATAAFLADSGHPTD